MIISDKEHIEIQGTAAELLTELTSVMNLLIKKEITTVDMLQECVNMAALSPEELKKQAFAEILAALFMATGAKSREEMMEVLDKLKGDSK